MLKNNLKELLDTAKKRGKDFYTLISSKVEELKKSKGSKLAASNKKEEEHLNTKKVAEKQIIMAGTILLVCGIFIYGFINIGGSKKASRSKLTEQNKEKFNVEVGSKSLDPEILWRNHFEDKLQDEKNENEAKIAALIKSVDVKTDDTLQEARNETESLRHQLATVVDRLEEMSEKMDHLAEDKGSASENFREGKIDVTRIYDEEDISLPRSTYDYIPETSYVKGTLLGGISVSTGIRAASEPVPVVIRLTSKGNLPKKFGVDIKACRILGSAYGDLSSERAVIRAESMVCENKELGEVLTTKIAGMIYGDDGANGIKGRVIDMSQKHIKNAAIGGVLSGFSGTMKSQGSFNLSALGAVSTKEPTFKEKLRDNTMGGVGNAAEKIADYYIRQAENMSPVLSIPGGTKVDVVFLKGVHLGSNNIASVLERERRGNEPD